MPKQPVSAPLHDPVSAILGTRGKIAVLRVLAHAGSPLQQREVARRTGMALRTVELAVADLLVTGIVDRVPGGREKLLRIRSSHRLTAPILALLRTGDDHWPALRGELRAAADSGKDPALLAVAVVGRAARREERLADPVDVVIIAAERADADRWVARYDVLAESLSTRFGAELRVIGYDLRGAIEMWAVRTLAAERAVREAELIHGAAMLELFIRHNGQSASRTASDK